ncbi:MAG: hypothetical protein JSV91_04795, partial [Phycisphaerales bacterium]
MSKTLARFKPTAPRRVQLLLAALMWTVVGAALLTFGTLWLVQSGISRWPWLLAGAIAAGILKAVFILGRAAARVILRIRQRGDGRCLGGFLSWRTWLLVLVMMAAGFTLRHSHIHSAILGTVYAAVGSALVL